MVPDAAQTVSRLQRELLPRIVTLMREDSLAPGDRMAEIPLSVRLQVSRTPVRAALRQLAAHGLLSPLPGGGFQVARPLSEVPDELFARQSDEIDLACVRISEDRLAGLLAEHATEAELMRRYGLRRSALLKVLAHLADVGLAERASGHGWRFAPVSNHSAVFESYAFRRVVEPAGLLEPGFALPASWAADMRRQHLAMMEAPWREASSIALFEMNAAFHEGLASASGNRFLALAVQQQTRLRRYTNYRWRYGAGRMLVSCREHLEILDRIEADDREVAAVLLRRHLDLARDVSLAP